MNKLKDVFFVITLLLIVILGYSFYLSESDNDKLKKENANIILQSKQRELADSRILAASNSQRIIAEHIVDSLTVVIGDRDRIHAAALVTLAKIKGSFDNLSSKQLSDKMIEEFNNRSNK